MIELRSLTKRYGSFTAVNGVDLDVPARHLDLGHRRVRSVGGARGLTCEVRRATCEVRCYVLRARCGATCDVRCDVPCYVRRAVRRAVLPSPGVAC